MQNDRGVEAIGARRRENLSELRVEPQDECLASAVHAKYSKLQAATRIASLEAMRWLAAVMRICRPRRVLELGSGIGTLTELMLRSAGEIERLYAVEPHTQCLDLLRKNLAPYDPKLVFIASEAELTGVEKPIELIVGDGGFYSPLEFLNAEEGRFFSLKV